MDGQTTQFHKILHGDALSVLCSLPDESVQTCITSPPYYGLRSYGTEPQIWGGDADCCHVWGEQVKNPKSDPRTPEEKKSQGGTVGTNVASLHWSNGNLGNFCQSCNAWRGEIGLEPTFHLYIEHLIDIFREVKRVLRRDGTCWVNLGDSYGTNSGNSRAISTGSGSVNSSKEAVQTRFSNPFIEQSKSLHKSLLNIPARFAIAMTDELQFIQRNEIIWYKRACMPSSAKDRFTVDFEKIFFFSKSPKYKFNQQLEEYTKPLDRWGGPDLKATQAEGWHTGTGQMIYRDRNMRPNPEGRNMRTTWDIPFEPQKEKHYASYPTKLIEPMVLAGTDEGDTVLDPFNGTGTTGLVALRHKRKYLGIELQKDYIEITNRRLREVKVSLI